MSNRPSCIGEECDAWHLGCVYSDIPICTLMMNDNELRDYCKKLYHELAEARTNAEAQGWVSVAEDLPENHSLVVVWNGRDSVSHVQYIA